MYKYGIHSSFGETDWNFDLFRAVRRHADNGLDAIEIFVPTLMALPEREHAELKALADACGIEMTFSTGLSKEHDLSSKDASVRRRGIEYVKRVLETIAKMGGASFGGVNYAGWACKPEPGEFDRRPYVENSMASMAELSKTAEDYGIDYVLEVVNRFETAIINTAAEGRAFVEAIGSPRLKLCLDTFHMNIEEPSFPDAIAAAGERLAVLHLGENDRRLPFAGSRTDWAALYGALRSISFRGVMTIESFITTGGEIGRDIGLYRDLTNGMNDRELDEALRRSVRFLKTFDGNDSE